jgi:hypothetical protein
MPGEKMRSVEEVAILVGADIIIDIDHNSGVPVAYVIATDRHLLFHRQVMEPGVTREMVADAAKTRLANAQNHPALLEKVAKVLTASPDGQAAYQRFVDRFAL